jgi:hypothetical protein
MTRPTIVLIILAAAITTASAETITGKAGVVYSDFFKTACAR